MMHFFAFVLPFALLIPQPLGDAVEGGGGDEGVALTPDVAPKVEGPVEGLIQFDAASVPSVQYQVRVEQRVIIRVSPQRPARSQLTATLPRGEVPRNMVERKIGKCLPLGGIAGVMPTRDNRLMLFMRDQRIIAANLEKACSARDYYSGFYVEPRKDGRICVERDKLQSRTGAKCELSRIRQLVAVDT